MMIEKTEKATTLSVRLDPKLRYGLEILARKQYRSLSSIVEWSLNEMLKSEIPHLDIIWDVYDADRLIKLAMSNPELLSYDEQKIWKVISEYPDCWRYKLDSYPSYNNNEPNYEVIRANWSEIILVAEGKKDLEELKYGDIPF